MSTRVRREAIPDSGSAFGETWRRALKSTTPPNPPRSIKSAERTLALFELFSSEQRGLTVGAITRQLHMPQPSATMLLKNLTALGYLEYDTKSRTYMPTLRIALLGSWMHRRFSDGLQLEHSLVAIQRNVGETSFIAIRNGACLQYVIGITAAHPARMEVQSGQFRPITCTAAGRALMSLLPDNEVIALTTRCNSEVKEDRLRVNNRQFLDSIQEVRVQGYAQTRGHSVAGLSAIAITAKTPTSDMPIAIGVGGTIEAIDEKRELILSELRSLQQRLSDAAALEQPV